MLEPEVDARARSGCHARTRIGKSTKERIDQDACFSLKPLFRVKAAATCFYKSEMAQSTSTSQSHPLCQGNPLRPNLGLNASRGSRPATGHRKTNRPQRKWQAAQYEEIQKGKELRVQNWAKRRERLNELSALDPEVLKALDMKECMLEVQGMLLGKLAAEENHLKGLAEESGPPIANFDERVQEVEEVIRSMQY